MVREAGVRPQLETVPGYYDPALGRELARLGYYQSGFHTSLVCEPMSPAAASRPASPSSVWRPPPCWKSSSTPTSAGRSIPQGAQFKDNVRRGSASPAGSSISGAARDDPRCRRHPLRARQGGLLRRRHHRSDPCGGPRPADSPARPPHRRRARRRRRLRVQRRRVPVPEPPQHGARRHGACSSCGRCGRGWGRGGLTVARAAALIHRSGRASPGGESVGLPISRGTGCETRRERTSYGQGKNTICLWYDKDAEAAAASTPRPFRQRGGCRPACALSD